MTPELLQKILVLLEPIANNTSEDPREDARNAIVLITAAAGYPVVHVREGCIWDKDKRSWIDQAPEKSTNCTSCRGVDPDISALPCIGCREGSNWVPLNSGSVNPNCKHTFVFSSKLGGQLCSLCGTPYIKSRHG